MAGELPQSIHSNEHVPSPEASEAGGKVIGITEPSRPKSSTFRHAFAEAAGEEEEAQVDMAAAVDAEIFGNGTIRGLAWVQDAIRSRANFAQRLPGTAEMTIGSGPGSLANMTAEERKRKADEDSQEWFDTMLDIGERKRQQTEREQQERERAEWAQSVHSFAGQDLTGKEWSELAESLKEGSKGESWLINYLVTKQGMSQNEATQYAHDMKDAADGMAAPHPTEKQKEAQRKIDANPKTVEITKDYRAAQSQDFSPVSAKTAHALNTDQVVSVGAGADALNSDPLPGPTREEQRATDRVAASSIGAEAMHEMVRQSITSTAANGAKQADVFPSAPNLTEHHQAAIAATEPLDAKKPVQIAAAPQATASAGLDV